MSGTPPQRTKVQGFIYRVLRYPFPQSWLAWISACLAPETAFTEPEKITLTDRAKMDYEYDLKLRHIWVERIAFGILIAVFVAGATAGVNYLTAHQLEEYKLKEARRQFFVAERLKALSENAAAMSGVSAVYFAYTGVKKNEPEGQAKEKYRAALEKAREVINKSQFLFGEGFNTDSDRYYEVHNALSQISMKKWAEYNDLIMDLSRRYDGICHDAVVKQQEEGDKMPRLPLKNITPEERRRMPPQEYLDQQFADWKKQTGYRKTGLKAK